MRAALVIIVLGLSLACLSSMSASVDLPLRDQEKLLAEVTLPKGRTTMPGNPAECREYALRCAELAHTARTPQLKGTLIDLSKNWMKLAVELESAEALLQMENPLRVETRKNARGR